MNRGRLRVFFLLLADLVSVYGIFAFVTWTYWVTGLGFHRNHNYRLFYDLWPFGLLFVILNVLFRLYQGNPFYPAAAVSPPEELRRLAASSVLTHAGLLAFLAFALQSTDGYSRFVIAVAGILTACLAQPVRQLVRIAIHRFRACRIPVVLIGPESRCARLARAFESDVSCGFRVVGSFTDETSDIVAESVRLGVPVAVFCGSQETFSRRVQELSAGFEFLEVVPSSETLPVAGAQATVFDGVGALELVNQRRQALLRAEKRVLDMILSVVAFVTLSPLFVLIPLVIKLTSRGPVFYRQPRLGKAGRPIRVWKFRSMYVDADARLEAILAADPLRRAEWEQSFKLSDDPRVTPFGRFLRRTSLDEIPQLFNVFAGEMALVGPRPIVEKEVAFYGSAYETFSSVRPGITGLWQASGRSDTDYARRVALDVHYVLNWSPWMDLWILEKTVGAVLLMRGAR